MFGGICFGVLDFCLVVFEFGRVLFGLCFVFGVDGFCFDGWIACFWWLNDLLGFDWYKVWF